MDTDYATKPLFQYVFDSSSLIFIERNKYVIQLRRRHSEVILPEKVAEEVKQPESPLETFLDHYPSVVTPFTSSEEELYLQIRGQAGIHDGEAAAITLALSRGILLVIEDKRGRTKAENHNIRCLTWQEFLHGALSLPFIYGKNNEKTTKRQNR